MEWSPTAEEAVFEKERSPAEPEREPKQGKQPMQPIALAHTFLGGSAVRNGEVSPAQRDRARGVGLCGVAWLGGAKLTCRRGACGSARSVSSSSLRKLRYARAADETGSGAASHQHFMRGLLSVRAEVRER